MKRKFRFDPAVLYILPGFAGFVVFFIWPFLISLGYAFMDRPVNGVFVGFKNFIGLFQNKPYLLGLKNTLTFIGISVPLNMALSLAVAMLINKVRKYRDAFTLIFLIPLVIPSGSIVFFWRILFSNTGFLNNVLHSLGYSRINWLDSRFALGVIIFIFMWKNMGYNMILYLSGLNGIPREYYEAAAVDGAGPVKTFRHITCVYLAPTFILVLIMSIINSFKVFKEIYLLTGSYPNESIYMLQHFMNNMFFSLNYPKLTTATSVLVLAISLLTQVLFRLETRVVEKPVDFARVSKRQLRKVGPAGKGARL